MSLLLVIAGVVVFLLCLCIHIAVWRVARPSRDAIMLFLIFILLPIGILICRYIALWLVSWDLPWSVTDAAAVMLLHFSLSAAYIAGYPAVQAISPSLDILLIIGSSAEGRMNEDDIIRAYRETALVLDRVEDLKIHSLITEQNGIYTLRPYARHIVRFFIRYRKMLGLPVGEG